MVGVSRTSGFCESVRANLGTRTAPSEQVFDEGTYPDGPPPRLLERLFLDNEAPKHMIALHQVIV